MSLREAFWPTKALISFGWWYYRKWTTLSEWTSEDTSLLLWITRFNIGSGSKTQIWQLWTRACIYHVIRKMQSHIIRHTRQSRALRFDFNMCKRMFKHFLCYLLCAVSHKYIEAVPTCAPKIYPTANIKLSLAVSFRVIVQNIGKAVQRAAVMLKLFPRSFSSSKTECCSINPIQVSLRCSSSAD